MGFLQNACRHFTARLYLFEIEIIRDKALSRRCSLTDYQHSKRWNIQPRIDEEASKALEVYLPFMRQILYNRGIRNIEQAEAFLSASQELSDPFLLTGMDRAVERLLGAIYKREKIVVYGDYDVDGVTATVMMVEALRSFGGEVERYIPNRFDEGYGLNCEAIIALANEGTRVILTVDCGIRSPAEAEKARELGVDLIISDHHHPKGDLPCAYAVICPKQEADAYPDKELAGVGVAFKILQGLLIRAGSDVRKADEWLDLVALGTVADIVPLTGENRVMVKKGILRIRTGSRIGLNALTGVAQKSIFQITAGDIGFILGPRLNAAGRMESALQAYDLLISQDIQEAGKLAQLLDTQNYERQQATKRALEKATQVIGDPEELKILFSFEEDYSSGIVGLVASKMVENFYRPAIIGQLENGVIRASCRSISEFHITAALDECAELLVRHGGHAMAAGFTVKQERVTELVERMTGIAIRELDGLDLRPEIRADLEIDIGKLNPGYYSELEKLQPTGMGNPTPVFVSRGVEVDGMRMMGKEGTHISFYVRNSLISRAVAFNQARWYDKWAEERPRFDIAYNIDINHYNGQDTQQINVRDMKLSGSLG
jgi:single-stranded-DNA-specific exonuclease